MSTVRTARAQRGAVPSEVSRAPNPPIASRPPPDRPAPTSRTRHPSPPGLRRIITIPHRAHVDEVTSYGGRGDGRRRAAPPRVVAQAPRRYRGFGTGTIALVARETPSVGRSHRTPRVRASAPSFFFALFPRMCEPRVRNPAEPRPPSRAPPARSEATTSSSWASCTTSSSTAQRRRRRGARTPRSARSPTPAPTTFKRNP